MVVAMATLLAFFHLPLPWYDGAELAMPFIYVAGAWVALSSSIAFTGIYAFRVAEEARLLANALSATELVLQREQHLSALDGLAAAAAHELGTPLATIALVAREMERALGSDPVHAEDVKLLRSQSERCREILKQLTSLSTESEAHLARLPLTSLVEEVTAPHRDFGIAIKLEPGERQGAGAGRPAQSRRHLRARQSGRERRRLRQRRASPCTGAGTTSEVAFAIVDDGPGFPPEIVNRIGEPYMSTRQGAERGGGLGLGLFIAKTLLERSGATLSFRNSNRPRRGRAGRGRLAARCLPRARARRRSRCSTRPDELRRKIGQAGSLTIFEGYRTRSKNGPKR